VELCELAEGYSIRYKMRIVIDDAWWCR